MVVTFRPAPELTRSFRRPGCGLLGVPNTRRRCACWGAGRNRIITAASQRVTARNTQERQPGATHDSVPIQRLHGKLRTAGHEAARLRQRGRYPPLVNLEQLDGDPPHKFRSLVSLFRQTRLFTFPRTRSGLFTARTRALPDDREGARYFLRQHREVGLQHGLPGIDHHVHGAAGQPAVVLAHCFSRAASNAVALHRTTQGARDGEPDTGPPHTSGFGDRQLRRGGVRIFRREGYAMQIKHRHISGEMPLSILIHATKVRVLEQMGRFRENAFRSVTHDDGSGPANAPTVFGCGSPVQPQTVPSKYPRALWLVCWRPHRRVGKPAPRFTPQPETENN